MLRIVLLLLLSGAWPGVGQAQAFRCTDATGALTYTDQPCRGGALVVAPPSAEEQAAEAERAAEAQVRLQALRATSQELEQARLAREQAQAALRATLPPAESSACRAARDAAAATAQKTTATFEEQRTARANAALACGQAPPEEPVVVWGGGGRGPRGLWPIGPGYPGVGGATGLQRPPWPHWRRPGDARPLPPRWQYRPASAQPPAANRRSPVRQRRHPGPSDPMAPD